MWGCRLGEQVLEDLDKTTERLVSLLGSHHGEGASVKLMARGNFLLQSLHLTLGFKLVSEGETNVNTNIQTLRKSHI